jgi:hypothetical protein
MNSVKRGWTAYSNPRGTHVVSVTLSGSELNAINRYRRERRGPLISRSAAIRELIQSALNTVGLGADELAQLQDIAEDYTREL